jgi:DNA-binding GntR family transcriptional regulator
VPVAPIPRPRLVDEITERLRESILSGQLAPGTQLLQIDLAEQLGVSRTPLREAFRLLERDGLIRVSNAKKTVEVVALSDDEILDMQELREVVAGLAASLVAKRGLPLDVVAALKGDLAEMDSSTLSPNIARYGVAHAHFHASIGEYSGNRWVADLVPIIRMSTQMTVSRRLHAALESGEATSEKARAMLIDYLIEGNRDHSAILDFILAGNRRQAEATARKHIRKGSRAIAMIHDAANLSLRAELAESG